jgi:hypothetical protein
MFDRSDILSDRQERDFDSSATDFAFPGKFVHSLLNSAAIMNLLIMKGY